MTENKFQQQLDFSIHPYQRIILKKLMYNPFLRFSQLQIPDISSKHFTYHLKQLREHSLIQKIGTNYSLTLEGKKYIDMVDEANMKIEKQPKLSVVVFPEKTGTNGDKEILLSKRLKHPNYGKIVGIGGKVRFGETFEEAARRELLEETGLTGDFQLKGVLRKIGFQTTGEQSHETVLDILFVLFHVTNVKGELITKFEDQENMWLQLEEVPKRMDISNTLPAFLNKGLHGSMDNFELISELEGF